MANLQIKGIEDALYKELKSMAASENRSVSQQVLYVLKTYLANRKRFQMTRTPAQILLELSGSWDDSRKPAEIIAEIKRARKDSRKLSNGF